MIDTDKYEGHTEGPWELSPDDWVWAEHLFMQDNTTNFGNAMLITDAPLLLAEVKDLKRQLSCMIKSYDSIIDAVREFIETDYCSHDGAEWLRYNICIVDSVYVTGEEEESE